MYSFPKLSISCPANSEPSQALGFLFLAKLFYLRALFRPTGFQLGLFYLRNSEASMTKHNDHKMQADFEAAGSVYPKVTAGRIDELMQQVTFSTHVVPGTTTTIATAILQVGAVKFTLANEFTACVDPRNFNAELCAKYAVQKATESARNKLWELEGYSLAQEYVRKASLSGSGTNLG